MLVLFFVGTIVKRVFKANFMLFIVSLPAVLVTFSPITTPPHLSFSWWMKVGGCGVLWWEFFRKKEVVYMFRSPTTSFDQFVGTLVFYKLLNGESLIEFKPFIIVAVSYEMGTNNVVPQSCIASYGPWDLYEQFDEAVRNMDSIDSGEWDLTVLEMFHIGDTVVWRDSLPMTHVG